MTHKTTEGFLFETSRLSPEEMAKVRVGSTGVAADVLLSLMIYHRDGVELVSLQEGRSVVVGRSAPADVAIRDDSLSRQHAVLEVVDGTLWVEDLGSTNGTWVNGKPCERMALSVDDEVLLGAVSAVVLRGDARWASRWGLDGHERFRRELASEVARAKQHEKTFALLLVRDGRRRESRPAQWVPTTRERLRSFDKMAMYSADTAEILLPEVGEAYALRFAKSLVDGRTELTCGVALYPVHGAGEEELIEVGLRACQKTCAANPVRQAMPDRGADAQSRTDAGLASPVTESAVTRRLFAEVARVAQSVIPVLILGETGTGKEVVARTIHQSGKRVDAPLVCVNCATIPSQLVESTLFGYERGAFTGAAQQTKGVFEAAQGGTVLLDEIGELPPAVQAALLRVLETRRLVRVGSTKEIEVDVRVLAATHRDLDSMAREGSFREDLLYRLNVMTLRVPPLRERVEDIEPLALRFLQAANVANQCQIESIEPDALRMMQAYGWPGNVRELRNAVERAVVIATGGQLCVEDLPEPLRELGKPTDATLEEPQPAAPGEDDAGELNLRVEVAKFEAGLILRALRACSWDRKTAAQLLGLPLRTLAHKMQLHNIRRVTYSGPDAEE